MKILFYGGNGWIGQQFIEYMSGHNVFPVLGKARVNDYSTLQAEVSQVNPAHIVTFAGRTSGPGFSTIDYLEQPGKLHENIRDNLYGPTSLALLCSNLGLHLTYLGTGCIFEYDNQHTTTVAPFTESDLPNFTGSSYSVVKGFTDRLMHQLENTVLNLRIRMPISNVDHPKNFISKIIRYSKICSIPNSMTVLDDFFPVWLNLISNCRTGTWNCTNPGIISHNEILEMYQEIVDPTFTWQNFTKEEQNKILASGRSNNYLSTEKLAQDYTVPGIKDSVRKTLQHWKSE